MLRNGLDGAMTTSSADPIDLQHLGRRSGGCHAPVSQLGDRVGVVAMDEILLEFEPAVGGQQLGPDWCVSHRQQTRPEPERCGKVRRHLGQALSLAQPGRAPEVEPQVAIAELEPGGCPEPREHRGARPGLIRDPPACLLVGEAGERVQQRVQVGRDGQPVELQVIARVPDDGEVQACGPGGDAVLRRQCQPVAELGATGATGKDRDAHR